MLDIKILSLIINEVASLSIRRDRNYYRLCLYIYTNKLNTNNCIDLSTFIQLFTINDNDYLFKYDIRNYRYYAYGSNVIKILKLLDNDYLLDTKMYFKVKDILENKELFTRTKGTKYTAEELVNLEEIYKYFNE